MTVTMNQAKPKENYYDKVKPNVHRMIGRELRLARVVIDLGCGSCDLVQYLARTYHQKVTGIDISDLCFPRSRHTPDGHAYHCLRRNAGQLTSIENGGVDAVVSMWAFHEMEQPDAVITEIRRVLRRGGQLLIVDFPKNSLAQKLWNENYYTPHRIRQMLEKHDFTEIRTRTIKRDQIMWITGHKPCTE